MRKSVQIRPSQKREPKPAASAVGFTPLKDKIQNALEEGRILILGAQVLVGVLYPSIFEPGYSRLSGVSRYSTFAALVLIVIAFGILMTPVAFHRIVEQGKDRNEFLSFVRGVMRIALLPFAFSLGLTLSVATEKLSGRAWGLTAGGISTIVALVLWYELGRLRGKGDKRETGDRATLSSGRENGMEQKSHEDEDERAKLKDMVHHVLTEARMVLPGAQALLGFQFITFLLTDFEKLPASSKFLHLASLFMVALSTILLMTPAAYHRIVEKGENSEEFHGFASGMVIAAMVPLALGICGDFLIVVRKVTNSALLATFSAILLLTFFYGLWFGLALHRRRKLNRA